MIEMILPSVYFGNIEYYHKLYNESNVIIDTHEKFQKQTYRSRCEILTANGRINLSVPVERPDGKNTLMQDVLISNAENWRKDHKKAIESAYRRTPYYEYYFEQLFEIIDKDFLTLHESNTALQEFLISKIGLTVQVEFTSESIPDIEKDYRSLLNPKQATSFKTHRYIQTFEERFGFQNNLSILDLLFNEGPNAITILSESVYG
jgi:hypothetical protein